MEIPPIACNLTTMTPAQRQHYREIKTCLRSAAQEVEELPDGYAFRYAADPALILAAAEFITLESRCCPFFRFVLDILPDGGPLWLRVTGPEEAKLFIKEALVD